MFLKSCSKTGMFAERQQSALTGVHTYRGEQMTADMAFEALIVSHDAAVLGLVNRVLQNLSICTHICLSPSKASDQLPKFSTELVIIDWEGPSSSDLVNEIWSRTDRKTPIIVAISSGTSRLTGVHIVLRKPVTEESAEKALK